MPGLPTQEGNFDFQRAAQGLLDSPKPSLHNASYQTFRVTYARRLALLARLSPLAPGSARCVLPRHGRPGQVRSAWRSRGPIPSRVRQVGALCLSASSLPMSTKTSPAVEPSSPAIESMADEEPSTPEAEAARRTLKKYLPELTKVTDAAALAARSLAVWVLFRHVETLQRVVGLLIRELDVLGRVLPDGGSGLRTMTVAWKARLDAVISPDPDMDAPADDAWALAGLDDLYVSWLHGLEPVVRVAPSLEALRIASLKAGDISIDDDGAGPRDDRTYAQVGDTPGDDGVFRKQLGERALVVRTSGAAKRELEESLRQSCDELRALLTLAMDGDAVSDRPVGDYAQFWAPLTSALGANVARRAEEFQLAGEVDGPKAMAWTRTLHGHLSRAESWLRMVRRVSSLGEDAQWEDVDALSQSLPLNLRLDLLDLEELLAEVSRE